MISPLHTSHLRPALPGGILPPHLMQWIFEGGNRNRIPIYGKSNSIAGFMLLGVFY
jgi:hypothetical protein